MRDRVGLVAFMATIAGILGGCHRATVVVAAPAHASVASLVSGVRQMLLVTTPSWESTSGELRRYERDVNGAWRTLGTPVPIVVGRTGLAWDSALEDAASSAGPRKREGDGKSPAGIFPLDTVFGFAPRDSVRWVRLPYVALDPSHDCVDDTASVHYNTVVSRRAVSAVDWSSAEHMRSIDQYAIGVIVGYNAAPATPGRGSCIFLHIWGGPGSHTAGCTAMDREQLREIVAWLDPRARPTLVQLTKEEYLRLRGGWGLPVF